MMRYLILLALLMCLPVRGEAWQVVGGGVAATGLGEISYEGSVGGYYNYTTFSISSPAGTSAGDLLILTVVNDNSTGLSAHTGWTMVERQVSSSSTTETLYRVVELGDGDTYEMTNSATPSIGVVSRFSKTGDGVWSVSSEATAAVAGTSITSASLSANSGDMLYLGWGCDDTVSVTTEPADMTAAGQQSANSIEVGTWYQSLSTSFSGTKSVGVSGTSDSALIFAVISVE